MSTHTACNEVLIEVENERIGRFEVLRTLGMGGMAELFLALDGEQELAIKRVRPDLLENLEMVSMFRDEARLAARLDHPNLVRALAIGEDAGVPFYAMELCKGVDASKLLKATREEGGVALPHALSIVISAARALHYAHELCDEDGLSLDVVHRDISPANVFVTFDGQVKVIDFGIAKAHGRTTETRVGVVKGKMAYMAPEQCMGAAVDRRTDVFALGLLLFELSTGTRAYRARADYELLKLAASAAVPAPESRRPGYPPGLAQILAIALAKDPEQRFRTAAAFATALEGFAREAGLVLSPRGLAGELARLFPRDAAAARPKPEPMAAVEISMSFSLPTRCEPLPAAARSLLRTPANAQAPARPRLGWRVATTVGWAAALALLSTIPGCL